MKQITNKLIAASKSKIQAELAISAIDWSHLSILFAQLGSQLSPEHESIIKQTTCSISSILATRDVLARVGDCNRRDIVRALCTEIVGWTGAWLSLTDTVDRMIEN
jgi:hypothetical protein